MKYQPEISLTKDEYEALKKDPAYRNLIKTGLECGIVEIISNDNDMQKPVGAAA